VAISKRALETYLREVSLKDDLKPDTTVYPFTIPALKKFQRLQMHPKVTFLVGENGSGKSTLIEGIAVAYGFNPEGGSRNFNFTQTPSRTRVSSPRICPPLLMRTRSSCRKSPAAAGIRDNAGFPGWSKYSELPHFVPRPSLRREGKGVKLRAGCFYRLNVYLH
jgi:AAA domain